MRKRPRRRSSLWRIVLLVVLIGAALYVNQVVVPATPPLFIPTPTPTRSPESFVNQAQQLYADGKLVPAMDAYREAINADPTNPSNYITLARLQVFAGDYEKAIQNTQNALLKNPNNPLAHAVQGWALGYQENFADAELELKKALSLDPNNALAHAYYSEVLINQRDFNLLDKAAEESRVALELDNSLLETHRARGIVLLYSQNLIQAIQEFKSALAINKNIADVHLYMGIAYQANNEPDLAEEAYLAAYALNPTDTTALTQIALAYFQAGRYTQAAQYAADAVNVEPDNPRLHGNLGIMHYKMEDYPTANTELALAVRGGVTEDGQTVEGLPLSNEQKIMEYYWYYGFSLAKSNHCTEAIPIFQALLRGVPNDETAVYNANYGIEMCQQAMENADNTQGEQTPQETSSEATATP
jgi:tetratricopeptide (TPR) repeat protein